MDYSYDGAKGERVSKTFKGVKVEWDATDAVVHFDGHPALTAGERQVLFGGTKSAGDPRKGSSILGH
jgi:hypothetical protein